MWHSHVTVAAVIEKNGSFLMVQEHDTTEGRTGLVWNQPAGHIEPGESLEQALVRETLEETGWLVQPSGLVGIFQWQKNDQITYFRFAYAAHCLRQQSPGPLDGAILNTQWMDEETIKQCVHRSPMVAATLAAYRQQAPLALSTVIPLG